jgi:CheY-like chemotaxis protein
MIPDGVIPISGGFVTATLLAVDDSKTMRKVIEITFAGENYRIVLADNPADALTKLKAEKPTVALVDALLGGASGYDLCQQIKAEAPQVGVIVLSSKQHPYDRVKGGAVGADDFLDKPYDTQALIDKVAALLQKVANAPAAKPAPAPAVIRPAVSAPAAPAPAAAAPAPAAPAPAAPAPAAPAPAAPAAAASAASAAASNVAKPHTSTMTFGAPRTAASTAGPLPAAARPAPIAVPSAQPPAAPAAAAPAQAGAAPVAASLGALVDASMETKLTALGLTKDQIIGVVALSREVIEQVVWEVVPVLAETMIREEIKRLTSE